MSTHQHSVAPLLRDDRSAPFFDAAAEGILLLQFSPSSGQWSTPTATACETTQATDLQWRASTGRGRLVSWTIIPRRPVDDVVPPPTVIGIVELDEGPWLTVQLVDGAEHVVSGGLGVTIDFVRPDDSESVPVGVLDAS